MQIMLRWFKGIAVFALLEVSQYSQAIDWVKSFDNKLNNKPNLIREFQNQNGEIYLNNFSESLRSPLAIPTETLGNGSAALRLNRTEIQSVDVYSFCDNQTVDNFVENKFFEQWNNAANSSLPPDYFQSPVARLDFQSMSMGLGNFRFTGTENSGSTDREDSFLDVKELTENTIVLPDPPAAAWSFLTAILAYLALQRRKRRSKDNNEDE
jgi:hypothetical protein